MGPDYFAPFLFVISHFSPSGPRGLLLACSRYGAWNRSCVRLEVESRWIYERASRVTLAQRYYRALTIAAVGGRTSGIADLEEVLDLRRAKAPFACSLTYLPTRHLATGAALLQFIVTSISFVHK